MFPLKVLTFLSIYTKRSDVSLILNAINQFQGYNLVIHYDNTSSKDVDDLLRSNVKEFCIHYLINEDLNDVSVIHGYDFLHVVLMNSISFNSLRRKTRVRDRVLIVFTIYVTESQLLEICRQSGPYGAGGVFILETLASSVSSCCYYCGRKKIGLSKIEMVDENMPQLEKFVNNFTDFGGYLFKVGFSQWQPLFYCNYDKYDKCVPQGSEFQLLQALSQKLNFRYELVEYTGYYNCGAWETMIQEVSYKKTDWAVSGISQNSRRSQHLDFTKYITYQGYMVIFGARDDQWLLVIQFLYSTFISNWIVVIAIGISVLGIALVTKWSLHDCDRSVMEYAFIPLVFLVEQQSSKLQKGTNWKPYVKIIFFLWWFVCCCLTTYYKTQQAYIFMSISTDPANMDEMAERGFKFTIHTEDFPYLELNCGNSSLKVCKYLMKTTDVVTDICGSIAEVLKNKVGYIEEESPLEFMVLRECNFSIDQKYSLNLVPVYPIPKDWHAWPMQKSTPFTPTFSRIFGRLEAGGLIQYWYAKNLQVCHSSPNGNHAAYLRSETNPLSLYHFLFPVVVLILGHLLSLVVFLIEVNRDRFGFKVSVLRSQACGNSCA